MLYFVKTSLFDLTAQSVFVSIFVVITFIIIAMMDFLDGYMARKMNQVTDLGKLLDPVTDKLFLCGIMFILTVFANFPLWAFLIIIFREVIITFIRSVFVKKKKLVIPASLLGKLKTIFTSIALGFLVAPLQYMPWFFSTLAFILLYVAVLLTVVSMIDYLISFVKLYKAAR